MKAGGAVGRLRENKFKAQTFAVKVVTSVLWDSGGTLLVEFLKRGVTVSAERFVQTLKLQRRISNVRPKRKMNQVLMNTDEVPFICMF
jgi:hypothetical protein